MALRASNAAPGLFPPVVLDGDLHVDGALLANLPASEMRRFNNGKVIAVDVSPAIDLVENAAYGESLSGWKILRSKLNPFSKEIPIPDIRTILRRAGELASVANQKKSVRNIADLYLRMPVDNYRLTDYDKAREIIEAGYRYGMEQIDLWQKQGDSF